LIKKETLQFIDDIFKALGSNKVDDQNVTFNSKIFNIKELNKEDIRIFAHCSKKFFKKVGLSSTETQEVLKHLNSCSTQLQERKLISENDKALSDIDKAKAQILMHELNPVEGAEVTDDLTKFTKKIKEEALENKEKLTKLNKGNKRIDAIAMGLKITGCLTVVAGALSALSPVALIAIPIAVVGLVIALSGLLIELLLKADHSKEEQAYRNSIGLLEKLNKINQDPKKFYDFATKNNLDLKQTNKFTRYIDLYALQQKLAEISTLYNFDRLSVRGI